MADRLSAHERQLRQEKAFGTGFNVNIWCNTDPCGSFCALLTWFLILYAESVVVGVVIYPWLGLSFFGLLHMLCFSLVTFMALISHGKAMLTDPGAVPESALPVAVINAAKEDLNRLEEQRYRTCRRCRQFKPSRAHHCSICERCVIKMDHHCPWVNNCVGLGNHKFFLLFIFYVFLMSLYALTLVVFRYAKCFNLNVIESNCPAVGALRVVLLVLEAVLFGLFTMCMMCDQYSVITTGTTQIDRLKGEISDNLGIQEVFGGNNKKFCWHWLLPVDIWFPVSVKNQLLGYVLEEDLMAEDDEVEVNEIDTLLQANATSSSKQDDGLPIALQRTSVTTTTTKATLQGGWSVEHTVVVPHGTQEEVV